MTARYHALTVVLEHDMREDDAEALLTAIRCLRGVAEVTGIVTDVTMFTAERRAREAIREKIYKLLKEFDQHA